MIFERASVTAVQIHQIQIRNEKVTSLSCPDADPPGAHPTPGTRPNRVSSRTRGVARRRRRATPRAGSTLTLRTAPLQHILAPSNSHSTRTAFTTDDGRPNAAHRAGFNRSIVRSIATVCAHTNHTHQPHTPTNQPSDARRTAWCEPPRMGRLRRAAGTRERRSIDRWVYAW